jgi:4-hydroxy-tetrahydrodipicolinate reductase
MSTAAGHGTVQAVGLGIGLLGRGRMGKVVEELLKNEYTNQVQLTSIIGKGSDMQSLATSSVVIDFALPDATLSFLSTFKSKPNPPALVVASTGWKLDQRKELEAYAALSPVIISANFSLGVLALMDILKKASPMLERLGYTPIISETHHHHKKDAPSGTALSLQRVIAPAGPGNVQTHSVRAGEIIGDHEVTFYGSADHLTFGHFAQDRSIFARGAIEAALWLAEKRAAGTKGILSIDTFFSERTSV